MGSFINTLIGSAIIATFFTCLQTYFFLDTQKSIDKFKKFFKKKQSYGTYFLEEKNVTQLTQVGEENSDLSMLILEINHYIQKTKGTTDFSVIQNKVERKINMRYDQSTARMAFPTYLGLMGTFLGVFLGILTFILGFDQSGNITDASIKNLLVGVLVSMFTSLCGLVLTTINNGCSGGSRKNIEEEKNDFYDFIQTELMPTLDVSMVTAITKLHQTVDQFEPAFNRVINSFQTTFNRCTEAFGYNFEGHVKVVSEAVRIMGLNMDKINTNIELQEKLLATLKSNEFVKGIDKYIEAANHFVGITQSLNKFEEARRMMLAAAQESIALQNKYNESLNIPREIAIRINQILDRIKDFENAVNETGRALVKRDILGNDVLNTIENQLKGLSRKGKIADKYLEMADVKLEEMYTEQTKVLTEMNKRYKEAIDGHISGFEKMLSDQTRELEERHSAFTKAIEERFQVEDIRKEFTNLNKLTDIEKQLSELNSSSVKSTVVQTEISNLQSTLRSMNTELVDINKNTKDHEKKSSTFGSLFGKNEKK